MLLARYINTSCNAIFSLSDLKVSDCIMNYFILPFLSMKPYLFSSNNSINHFYLEHSIRNCPQNFAEKIMGLVQAKAVITESSKRLEFWYQNQNHSPAVLFKAIEKICCRVGSKKNLYFSKCQQLPDGSMVIYVL